MRAVWSFWSKPYLQAKGLTWASHLHHWLAWGLSLRLARRHYPETTLVTDRAGKALLVDRLGLSFTHVSTELDSLSNADPGWWALGKLLAYTMQDQPFVHLDTDVFLWKPLPSSLASAAVFTQCPEEHSGLDDQCKMEEAERAFAERSLLLPAEWEWARSRSLDRYYEANCGIVGGTRTDFIQYFGNLALDLVLNSAYSSAWAAIEDKFGYNMLIEQFLILACADFHRSHPESPFRGINMRYLFASTGEAMNQEAAARVGFTHLWGGSKRDSIISRRLEERTQHEDIHFYRHCLRLSQDSRALAATGV